MAKIDFHVHSRFSVDSLTSISAIYKQAKKTSLTGLALTDHNEFRGVAEFKKLLKEKHDNDFALVPGMELKIDKGEILALFLQEPIKNRTLDSVIDEAKQQDALLCLPHPFDSVRRVVPKVNELTSKQVAAITAVEVFNSRNAFQKANHLALELAEKHNKAKLAGSDAHWQFEVGNSYTSVNGNTLEELKRQIRKRKTAVHGSATNPLALMLTKGVKTLKPLIAQK